MENMQQGQWKPALDEEKKKKCSFWVPEFSKLRPRCLRSIDKTHTEPSVCTEIEFKDGEKQGLLTTDRQRAGGTLRETDPSYNCPAGDRIGGIGEAQQGPAIGSM